MRPMIICLCLVPGPLLAAAAAIEDPAFIAPLGISVCEGGKNASPIAAIDGGRDVASLVKALPRVKGRDGSCLVRPAGVTATWWAQAHTNMPHPQDPCPAATASVLSTTPDWAAQGGHTMAMFGVSVARAGDVNGDGYADVIVGAPGYQNGKRLPEGGAFVYHGSVSGLSMTPNWTAGSTQENAQFGISVGTAGDVNGDGYDDVIVGASFTPGYSDKGRAYVYYGSATGLSSAPGWAVESREAGERFGVSVGTAGDVNGDGYDDVIVGAPDYSHGQSAEGRAYVYYGSATGLSTTARWTVESEEVGARFGGSVGTAGDVNGDGYDDVVVGAPRYGKGDGRGRALVYLGSASGLLTTPSWTAAGDQDAAHFGHSVARAGDVNGDGYDDVIVGARGYGHGENEEGRALLFYGSASGLSTTANWTTESNQVGARWVSVAAAGDINHDGYDDVIVGAELYKNGEEDEGGALLFYGSPSGLSVTAGWTAEGNQVGARLGHIVGTAGDVDGDGYDDVILGAPDAPMYMRVEAVVFRGRATPR